MTLKERIIVETYTGFCMTTGRERDKLYKYMGELLGRPVVAPDLCRDEVRNQLRARALPDFRELSLTEEAWNDAKKEVQEQLARYEALLERYNKGERTLELYDEMTETQ